MIQVLQTANKRKQNAAQIHPRILVVDIEFYLEFLTDCKEDELEEELRDDDVRRLGFEKLLSRLDLLLLVLDLLDLRDSLEDLFAPPPNVSGLVG